MQLIVSRQLPNMPRNLISEHLIGQIIIPLIVSSWYRCVGRETGDFFHLFILPVILSQEFKCTESRMTFIQVVIFEIFVPKSLEHFHPSNPEDRFLCYAVVRI